MVYNIKARQRSAAKKMGYKIKPSSNKKKKLDVFENDTKIGSIGAIGYMDYASYIKSIGKKEADKKRDAYLKRHAREPKMKDGKPTNSKLADVILWS